MNEPYSQVAERQKIVELISTLDRALGLLRKFWLDSKIFDERQKWRSHLNDALDERLELMRRRDSLKPKTIHQSCPDSEL